MQPAHPDFSDLGILYATSGPNASSDGYTAFLLAETSDRYKFVIVGPGAEGPEAAPIAGVLRRAIELVEVQNPAGMRLADYLGVGLPDRLDRVPQVRRLFGGLYASLRPLSLIRPDGSPLSVLRVVRCLTTIHFRRLADAVAIAIGKSTASLILVVPTMPLGARLCLLAAGVRARIPVVFLPPDESASHLVRRLVHVVEPTARRVRQRRLQAAITNTSDLYGARSIVSEYCGIAEQRVQIPGFWVHGWIPAYHNVQPEIVAQHKRARYGLTAHWARDPFDKGAVQLVARTDQEEFLRAHGYTRIKAIGHPRVYLTQPATPRIPNSLLVMPPHRGTPRLADDSVVHSYVECIAHIAQRFSTVRVCVSTHDYLRRNWWVAFEEAGIRHVVGADSADPRASHRMARLMQQFEYMTTNGYGSHIVYAAMAGCKVSIFGPFAEVPADLLRTSHVVAHYPKVLELLIELYSERALRQHYGELFDDADRAKERVSWARQELGYDYRLTPGTLRQLVTEGWEVLGEAGAAMEHP